MKMADITKCELKFKKLEKIQQVIINEMADSVTSRTLFLPVLIDLNRIVKQYQQDNGNNIIIEKEKLYLNRVDSVYSSLELLQNNGYLFIKKLYFGSQKVEVQFTTDGIFLVNETESDKELISTLNEIVSSNQPVVKIRP